MTFSLNDVVTEVRRLIQDENAPYRYSDPVLVSFANQALKRIAVLRPDLFAIVENYTCTQDAVIQTAPTHSLRMIEVYQVVGGDGVIETTREALDQAYPTWMNDTAAATQNWMRHPRNPKKFFIYPKAPAWQQLVVEYAKTPITYAGDATVAELGDAYIPVVIDATVFLAESIDNEHISSQRAELFQKSFTQALGVGIQQRALTDTETSGEQEEGV